MQKTCRNSWCKQTFEVTSDDLKFYEKVSPVFAGKKESILLPTQCPECRHQRRWATRNERNLYRRLCDRTRKEMLSLYSSDSPHTVFGQDVWGRNEIDTMSYGRSVILGHSFFDQFRALLLAVPRRGMQQDETNQNCEFTTFGGDNKDCYMAYACKRCENVYYSTRVYMAKDVTDSVLAIEGELLYECADCEKCYHCAFCRDSENCQDSFLLDHCHNCKKCIACKNLRNKEYHFYNHPIAPEEYESYMKAISYRQLEEDRRRFEEWKLTLPFPYAHIRQAENATGDYLDNVKNCFDCFDTHRGAEDCRYCLLGGMRMNNVYDGIMIGMSDLLYEVVGVGPAQRCAFVSFAGNVNNVFYSDNIFNCSDCFGCVDIKHKQYCILNRQYTKEEYERLVPKIIEHMRRAGEWGEFFPVELSPFAYNETVAQEYFPLTKEEVLKRGWRWRDQTDEMPKVEKVIPAAELPDSIDDIPDDILNWAIQCETTKRPFKIVRQELEFYRKMRLPVPRFHPDERHRRRMALRNPRKLWKRTCGKCGKGIETTYPPSRPEMVYCEQCYLAEVY